MEEPIVIISKNGRVLYKLWRGEDISTTDGIIKADAIRKKGIARTSKGESYLVMKPLLRDYIQYMRKGARPIYEYDAGMIASLLSLQKGDNVLEAGTGSACTTLAFANIVYPGKVYTFEKEERFYEIAVENIKHSGFDNIVITHGDILKQKLDMMYDAVFLDMNEPVKAIEHVCKHLKQGRFLAVFTPVIDHVRPVIEKMSELGFVQIQSIQLDLKEVELKKYLRIKGLFGFPGFVVVGRKFSNEK
ncbi:MAG: methyltransferase domain-containing protein [Candidatus Diapherotrites archaeon]|nr:methyltransferase domain-containing protein [Candidatus Diapherotrites archaeon]